MEDSHASYSFASSFLQSNESSQSSIVTSFVAKSGGSVAAYPCAEFASSHVYLVLLLVVLMACTFAVYSMHMSLIRCSAAEHNIGALLSRQGQESRAQVKAKLAFLPTSLLDLLTSCRAEYESVNE